MYGRHGYLSDVLCCGTYLEVTEILLTKCLIKRIIFELLVLVILLGVKTSGAWS